VKERIQRIYRRKAIVIYPPVDTSYFVPLAEDQRANEYFLMVGRFVAYKGFEFVIELFNERDENLLIVGDGPLRSRFLKLARNPKIEFVGVVADEELRVLYQNALALIFPAMEDFGLAPVEAMACGTPVIGYGKGGCAESVIDGVTGILFDEQSGFSLSKAIAKFYATRFDRSRIRQRAFEFDTSVFAKKITEAVQSVLQLQ
jgi:glycosyltransferase involved in cell wall biosynthesis